MKRSLVIISFAFIFLLSVSVVSANFFDWITGDVGSRTGTADILPTTVEDKVSCPNCADDEVCDTASGHCIKSESSTSGSVDSTSSVATKSGTTSRLGTSTTQKRSSRGSECPRGWNILSASEGGNCCRKAENRGRTATGRLFLFNGR